MAAVDYNTFLAPPIKEKEVQASAYLDEQHKNRPREIQPAGLTAPAPSPMPTALERLQG